MTQLINLYDTSTLPTPAMREAMHKAPLGDDVYGRDPTVNRLEEEAAALVGKENALFVPSGTMGNLVAALAQTSHGDEVILEAESHMYYYESGGIANVAGLMPRLVKGNRGVLDPGRVRSAIRKRDIHYPHTALLCIENTHNRAGGTITSPDVMNSLRGVCKEHGLRVHLDGARIFDAAVALGIPVTEFTSHVDSVMFCLSKGLSAPVGSILASDSTTIHRARRARKMLGGGMRQAGVVAAAGLVAIKEMIDRLSEDHDTARRLAQKLSKVPGIRIDMEQVQTNMVLLHLDELGMQADEMSKKLLSRGVKVSSRPPYVVRMVTHRHIGPDEVEQVVAIVADVVRDW